MSAPQSAGVSPAHTSVPRRTARTAAALPVDPLAAGYVVVATAPEARTAARQFAARLPMPAILVDAYPGLGGLTDVLTTVRVGWRFAVIGPDPVRSRCRAAILAAGAIDAEIVTAAMGFGSRAVPGGPAEDVDRAALGVGASAGRSADVTPAAGEGVPARYGAARETGDELREVFCAHCRTATVADVPVGGETRCAGCGHRLAVYHHFSRRLHAYLGYRPDAEELP